MSTSSVKYAYPCNLNVANFVSFKLSTSNYLLWETQMLSLIESQDLLGFINGDIVAPDSEVNSSDENQRVPNPDFTSWVRTDRLVKAWITGTFSEEALDTGTTAHITTDPGKLSNLVRYQGSDSIMVVPEQVEGELSTFTEWISPQIAQPVDIPTQEGHFSALEQARLFTGDPPALDQTRDQLPTLFPPTEPEITPLVSGPQSGEPLVVPNSTSPFTIPSTTSATPPSNSHSDVSPSSQSSCALFHPMITRSKTGIVKANPNVADSSLFVYRHDNQIMILLLYVDDIILTGNNNALLDEFTADLGRMFSMKDSGPLNFFLGIQVNRTPDGLFLHQSKYVGDLLQHAMMVHSKPIANRMAPKSFSLKNRDSLFHDPTLFWSIVGSLQYLTMTRPDLSYIINVVCQHMHRPTQAAFQLMKRILRYVKGTNQLGLQIRFASSLDLYAFCDADWAGCSSSRRSTTDFCTFLGSNYISWSAKKQSNVARSNAKAEYRAMAFTTVELTWLSFLLRDVGIVQHHPSTLFCDNLAALYMSINPVFHARTKHIEVDYHFVREKVAIGSLVIQFVSSNQQLADIFTKPLSRDAFQHLRTKLGLCSYMQPSLRGSNENLNSNQTDPNQFD
ncbi:hypothetical protein RJ640_009878 [Escallonia rubra]|uniref:Reverse transcriptase Ty1/copia-type domain-containing protein n=1 Tax=Escallonia rubra TaxID=112253 RepID=A0AA88RK67_9ASTE|nr:hypothetical protein RJ640_009878 [Escallonia rubra]